jgi:hypothetical protein
MAVGPGPSPRYESANVVRGPAAVWYQGYSPIATLPDNTLDLGGDWKDATKGDPLWTPIGATQSGVTLNWSRKTTDITIEEQSNAVDVATDSLDPTIDTTLSEDTLETMLLAYGGGVINTVAPSATEPGYREIKFTEELDHLTLGVEGINNKSYWRRILWQDVLSVATVKTDYTRSKTQRVYAVSFRLLSPITDMVVREMNLPKTS